MSVAEREALQNSFRLEAVIHNGHVWDIKGAKIEQLRHRQQTVTRLQLPSWVVWRETRRPIVFAAVRQSTGSLIAFSNRERTDITERRRDSEVFDLGPLVLHREVIYDRYGVEPVSTEQAHGVGRSLVGSQFEVMAADSGDPAHLTVMLTNMDSAVRALPNWPQLAAA